MPRVRSKFRNAGLEKRPIRRGISIVDGVKLAGAGAPSYSAGDATKGLEEAAKFKKANLRIFWRRLTVTFNLSSVCLQPRRDNGDVIA